MNSSEHSFITYKQPHAFLKTMIDYINDAEPLISKKDRGKKTEQQDEEIDTSYKGGPLHE